MNLRQLHLDKPLFYALLTLAALSLAILYSASARDMGTTSGHFVRLLIGFAVLVAVAQLRPEVLARWSPYFYGACIVLLLAVVVIGVMGKGAQRWLNLGIVRAQPSEFMKLAVPMALAWYLSKQSLPPSLWRIGVALVLVMIPVLIIVEQPDLGTAVLVLASGIIVIFLAGIPWRYIVAIIGLVAASAPVLWNYMQAYQRNRVLTLLNPEADPLGSGYHTIQAIIAIGSGGFYGKGWLNSSQAHLEYLPESSTDFIFAVFAEEFGLIGITLMLGLYGFIVIRGFMIAFYAQDGYTRLLAGTLSLTFFLNFFVNIGMVTGILPVVGIPLPMMSYGGSSIVALMAGFGILMSIYTHRKIVEH
jgi:rod shape determining protein RodA